MTRYIIFCRMYNLYYREDGMVYDSTTYTVDDAMTAHRISTYVQWALNRITDESLVDVVKFTHMLDRLSSYNSKCHMNIYEVEDIIEAANQYIEDFFNT